MAGALPSVGSISMAPLPETLQQTPGIDVTYRAMTTIVQQLGIPLPQREGIQTQYTGVMPESLTSLTDENLGDLLNDIDKWCGYLDFCVARSDGDRSDAAAAMEFLQARVRLTLKSDLDGRKLTQKDKDDLVIADSRVQQAMERHRYCEAVYKMTRAIRDNAQRDWETVSRRITQRGQEVDRMRREHAVGGVPINPARTFMRRTT